MDSSEKTLAKRYARAYAGAGSLQASSREAAIEAASSRIAKLEALADILKPYGSFLGHPAISASVKTELLEKISDVRGPEWNLILLLIGHGRFNLLGAILSSCHAQLDEMSGILRSEIRTPFPLPASVLEKVKKIISPDPKKVILTEILDKSIIGGFELKTGDVLLDASLRGRLKALEKTLAE